MGDAAAMLTKFHSVVRWGKPLDDIKAALEAVKTAGGNGVEDPDPQNGNRVIHLSAQNGHLHITKWLVSDSKCDINSQNNKGQTALHMSSAYDMYQ